MVGVDGVGALMDGVVPVVVLLITVSVEGSSPWLALRVSSSRVVYSLNGVVSLLFVTLFFCLYSTVLKLSQVQLLKGLMLLVELLLLC